MRKLFLLGTMLSVATTALAFGGMFNHGSKSTTYKGGVSAIGVHFGGEKKTMDVEAEVNFCASDADCGEGHTCQEGQCCDKEGHCCDSSGYSNRREECCPAGEKAYIAVHWNDDEIETDCCSGRPEMEDSDDEGYYSQSCCPYYFAEIDVCCWGEGEKPYCSRGSEDNCLSYSCGDGDVSCMAKNADGECMTRAVCPKGQVSAANKCFPDGACEGETECCVPEQRTDLGNMYACCPDGKIGYCRSRYSEDTSICFISSCCAPDKISYGTGENGADECLE